MWIEIITKNNKIASVFKPVRKFFFISDNKTG
jgi:hypothetical protein